MIDDNLLGQAIEKWGKQSQTDMAIEECSELITAIIHFYRGREHNVIEELADATIAIRQVSLIFGIEEVDKIIDFKMQRLRQRLNNGQIPSP